MEANDKAVTNRLVGAVARLGRAARYAALDSGSSQVSVVNSARVIRSSVCRSPSVLRFQTTPDGSVDVDDQRQKVCHTMRAADAANAPNPGGDGCSLESNGKDGRCTLRHMSTEQITHECTCDRH